MSFRHYGFTNNRLCFIKKQDHMIYLDVPPMKNRGQAFRSNLFAPIHKVHFSKKDFHSNPSRNRHNIIIKLLVMHLFITPTPYTGTCIKKVQKFKRKKNYTTSATTKVLPPIKIMSLLSALFFAAARASATVKNPSPIMPPCSASAISSATGFALGMSG